MKRLGARPTKCLLAALVLVPFALGACGGSQQSAGDSRHRMPDGTVMSGSTMPHDQMSAQDTARTASAPSETASMICGDEVSGAVQRAFELSVAPSGVHTWAYRTYACTYQLHGGSLRLSVKDLNAAGPGRAYYDGLRASLPGATRLRGLASYGFPAFETKRGDVVFIKDHKTLWVDASGLGAGDLPAGTNRQDAAYAVAAAVIACWSE